MKMTAKNKFKLAGLINISDAFLGVLMFVIIIAAQQRSSTRIR